MPESPTPTGVDPMPPESPTAPPSGAPDMAPVEPSGEIEQAKANVQLALSMLEQALPVIKSETEEGSALLSAIKTLSAKFHGKKSADIAPAEVLQMISGLPEGYKQDLALSQAQAAQPAGIPTGPHVPANLNP